MLLLAACGDGNPTTRQDNNFTSFTDDYSRMVQVPTHPRRIVSTSPAVTEIIFALGGENLLVGRTDFCTYPPEALAIESIGGISNLNVEKIVSLHPDLVISGSMIPQKSTDQLEKMGVATVHVVEQSHFDGLYDNIGKIGRLIGHDHQADSLIRQLRTSSKEIVSQDTGMNVSPDSSPTIYYVVGFGASGNFTAGGNSFINDIIRMAGGRNIAEGITGWNYSLEALFEADPEYIVIRREDSAAFCNMHPYDRLTAVRQHRVIGINSGLIDLQVPRNIEAVQIIHHAIH